MRDVGFRRGVGVRVFGDITRVSCGGCTGGAAASRVNRTSGAWSTNRMSADDSL